MAQPNFAPPPKKPSLEEFLSEWAAENICMACAKARNEGWRDRPFAYGRSLMPELAAKLKEAGYAK